MSNIKHSINKVNLAAAGDTSLELFEYLKVGDLNDHMLNVVEAENRTLDFHIHEDSDEMFYMIEGSMQLEFEDQVVDLNQGDFIIVPKGVSHRPICTTRTKLLLIEKKGTLNKDNTGGTYRD